MDPFKVSQLTKEIVLARLREMADPCVAAAALVKRTLEVAFKDLKPGSVAESRIVEEACQGGMTALLLNDQDIVRGAVAILEAVVDLAHGFNLDQQEMMRSALRGIADMRRFASPDILVAIRAAVEDRFHGAGLELEALCKEPSGSAKP